MEASKAPQERGPARAVLGGDHVQAQYVAMPIPLADPLGERNEEHLAVGASRGRPRNAVTCSSRTAAIRHTREREMPSMRTALTTSSTRRVDTPST